jgi:hypothetical protein
MLNKNLIQENSEPDSIGRRPELSVPRNPDTTSTVCIYMVDGRIKREFIFKKLCL